MTVFSGGFFLASLDKDEAGSKDTKEAFQWGYDKGIAVGAFIALAFVLLIGLAIGSGFVPQ